MNNDLISREALEKAIKTECNPYGKPTIDFESGKRVLKIIDNAPTVEERSSAKWEYIAVLDKHFCDECGNYALWPEGGYREVLSNFCPNCGAEMRKGEE